MTKLELKIQHYDSLGVKDYYANECTVTICVKRLNLHAIKLLLMDEDFVGIRNKNNLIAIDFSK